MPKKARKSSRAANLHIRLRQIANGMGQARPDSPTFTVQGKRLVKLNHLQRAAMDEQADSLAYFAR